jgi:hypothetical protein
MKLTKAIGHGLVVALYMGAMMSTPALAQQDEFSALRGIDVQSLSSQEMGAIAGKLNAYDIAAALIADAQTLAKYPKLQVADLQLADYFNANAAAINATFAKLGVLTPCKTCM